MPGGLRLFQYLPSDSSGGSNDRDVQDAISFS